MTEQDAAAEAQTARLERRVERERRARVQAEDLLEAKAFELFQANQALSRFASELEQRVEDRTRELAAARARAITLAERDQLTGLPNRMCFGQLLDAAMVQSLDAGTRFALLLIDLDNFKDINDSLGHEAGDVFLQTTAIRLRAVTPEHNVIARLGGDEFAVLAFKFDSLEDLAQIAKDLIDTHRMPVAYRDRLIEASCSVGVAVFPDDANDIAELQRYADLALYKSKAAGRNGYTLFDCAMKTEFEDRHSLGSDLKQAIRAGLVRPWFQPIVKSDTNSIVGVEALARWLHPVRGMLAPDAFLRLAEERGLMHDLFTWMLRSACVQARRWIDKGMIQYLSVNVSPSQFRSGSLADGVLRVVEELGFPPKALMVEITEDVLLFDLDRARLQLEQLACGGVRIALDDFGIGYSNIASLRRLPIHTIKIDRSLTADIRGDDQKGLRVLGAIIEIARALDLDLIAEGVEDRQQAGWLRRLGCRYLQGFFFGRPMAADVFNAHYDRPPNVNR